MALIFLFDYAEYARLFLTLSQNLTTTLLIHVECSTTFGINGTGADGDVTVSAEQQEIAAYVFADTQATGA